LDFESKQVNSRAHLDLALTPFLGEPCEPGFEGSTAGVVVDECGVVAEGMADPERFQVGFERADEDGGGFVFGYENGKQLGLDLGEGRRSHDERCLGDA
jgi:hypothetical protein